MTLRHRDFRKVFTRGAWGLKRRDLYGDEHWRRTGMLSYPPGAMGAWWLNMLLGSGTLTVLSVLAGWPLLVTILTGLLATASLVGFVLPDRR